MELLKHFELALCCHSPVATVTVHVLLCVIMSISLDNCQDHISSLFFLLVVAYFHRSKL